MSSHPTDFQGSIDEAIRTAIVARIAVRMASSMEP